MATAVLFFLKGAIRFLFIIITNFRYCMFSSQKKVHKKVHSPTTTFFFTVKWMTEKKYVSRNERERERERQTDRTRRTFFFCLLPKCSIRLFFSASGVKKKWKEEKSRVQRQHHSFSLLCMSVRLLHPQSFFFCMCVRAFGVCKYINASESRQIEKREKRGKKLGPKTNGKRTNSSMLSRCW